MSARWVVRGGGLAGWGAAAVLAGALPSDDRIEVIDGSDQGDGPLAVATLDAESAMLAASGMEAGDLLLRTGGGFHLGTALDGWTGRHRIWVCGQEGLPLYEGVAVHDIVLAVAEGAGRRGDYLGFWTPLNFQARAAAMGRYGAPSAERASPRSLLRPGIAVDRARLRDRLRERALALGVVVGGGTGEAHLIVDTRTPAQEWRDETERLGFDRIVTGWRAGTGSRPLHLTAQPLANGFVVVSPLDGGERVVTATAGESLHDPDLIDRQETCARAGWSREPWRDNIVAIGPAAACLGPLFGQDVALLDRQLALLIQLLPSGPDTRSACAAEYNRRHDIEATHRADLIQLALRCCARPEPFWAERRAARPSDTLARRLQQFQLRNRSVLMDGDPFDPPLWLSTMIALGHVPRRHDPRADQLDGRRAAAHLGRTVQAFDATLKAMPTHDEVLAKLAEPPAAYEWPTEFADLQPAG